MNEWGHIFDNRIRKANKSTIKEVTMWRKKKGIFFSRSHAASRCWALENDKKFYRRTRGKKKRKENDLDDFELETFDIYVKLSRQFDEKKNFFATNIGFWNAENKLHYVNLISLRPCRQR